MNIMWRRNTPHGSSSFEVFVYVPESVISEIAASAAAGLLDRLELRFRLERAFLPDRDRPHGPEDEPVFLPPLNENGWQIGPSPGYVSVFRMKERTFWLGQHDKEPVDDLPADTPVSDPIAVTSPLVADALVLKMIASRLGYLTVLVMALTVVVLIKR